MCDVVTARRMVMSENSEARPAFPASVDRFCITDVGSTTTKATLFVKEDAGWTFVRKEAPTTVEKPDEDVTIGVLNAIRGLEGDTGRKLIENDAPAVPFLCTSSAGGGLAMVVAGLVRHLTAESADRAALGAGAIVLDVMAMNDGRTPYRKIEDLKRHRPDMVLLAGGFDGDNISGPVYLAELIVESGLRPKLDPEAELDIVYAGNVNAREYAGKVFGSAYQFHPVPNIRPAGNRENPEPARKQIHELFMNHVMSQAPGYQKIKPWVASPIRPTPAAVANLLELVSRHTGQSIMVIDAGGATTDVFSAVGGKVFRTVSANLGLSYSIRNVAEVGGVGAIGDFAGVGLDRTEIWNRIGNKQLNPTEVPGNPDDMRIEWAAATVAIREAVRNHLEVMRAEEEGPPDPRPEVDALIRGPRRPWEKDLVPGGLLQLSLRDYDLVIGSGGILSHSPRSAAVMMLVDALQPEGVVEMAVDSAFIFPHLGVLAEVDEELARELFFTLGLVYLGTLYAPSGTGHETRPVTVRGETEAGQPIDIQVLPGEVRAIPLGRDRTLSVAVAGKDPVPLKGGACGLVVDNRPRPVSSGAHDLLPQEYPLPVQDIRVRGEARISRGAIRMRRELAIPGEVFVKVGETVRTDTLVARSSRQFLRPFFIDVAGPLGIPPEDTEKYLVKTVGERIDYGDVIARRPKKLVSFDVVRSNVRAVIERILPNGAVVARELPEMAREYVTVKAAQEIDKPGWQVRRFLRVEKGQEVERGQWLAAELSPHGIKYSASPVRGRVNRIDYGYGLVVVEPLLEELDVLAWLPGRVESLTPRGCEIAGEGTGITGVWGFGGEVSGPLVLGDGGRGDIVVRDFTDASSLTDLEGKGVAGLITGGLNLEDMIGAEPGFTVVMTDAYGLREMSREIHGVLETHQGRLALLDGTTQLRVGVKRPILILPA
jgi:uncharacterized protein (TIGR01319 family)